MIPFRKLFEWEYARVYLLFLLGSGVSFALRNHFLLAYAFLMLFGLSLVLLWLFSDRLAKKRDILKERRVRKDPELLRIERKKFRAWQIGVSVLLAAFALGWILWVRSVQATHELESLQGLLLPANDPDSQPDICSGPFIPRSALKIHLGKFEVFASQFPYTVLAVNKKKAIVLNRDKDGRIAVTVEIRDKDGKVVVVFENGRFSINENNFLKKGTERPDKNTLIVYDQWNNEVLNARYANPHFLEISALLQYPGAKPVTIPKDVHADVCLGDIGSTALDIESH